MHIPVLIDKIIEYLCPQDGKIYVDATIGCGGYVKQIISVAPNCKIIGLDWDSEAIEYSKKFLHQEILENKVVVVKGNYIEIKNVINKLGLKTVDGVIFDFGMSALQLKSSRGFSFLDENFDMRMDVEASSLTAKYIVNNFSKKDLEKIFLDYGEERYSSMIAKKIVEYRQKKEITSAKEFAEIVSSVVGKYYKKSKIHPATRVFQALRIFINNELQNINIGINNAIDILSSGGRCLAVSYHSLEDRIVKNIFRNRKDCKIITKKPICPDKLEIEKNYSSRSAKLRVVEKL